MSTGEIPLDGPPSEGPYEHLLHWRPDGTGIRVCVDAQKIYFPRSGEGRGEAERAIEDRFDRYGLRYRKVECRSCGGCHLEMIPPDVRSES